MQFITCDSLEYAIPGKRWLGCALFRRYWVALYDGEKV